MLDSFFAAVAATQATLCTACGLVHVDAPLCVAECVCVRILARHTYADHDSPESDLPLSSES